MAYTTVDKPALYNSSKLWTGTGAENAITGVGFQPDFVWIKQRDFTRNHNEFDAIRGATKRLYPDLTNAEETAAQVLKSFDSDGFTLGTDTSANANTGTYVAWNWKMNGAGSSNGNGSITSTVSVDTTAKQSIVKYTGTGSNATIGHGLGVAPNTIFVKSLASANWAVYSSEAGGATGSGNLGPTKYLQLNLDGVQASATDMWYDTAPTTTVFSTGGATMSGASAQEYIAYCFAKNSGYYDTGIYRGIGSATGPVVYTGFRPSIVICKKITGTAAPWLIYDESRLGYNRNDTANGNNPLYCNTDAAEVTDRQFDIFWNGFQVRNTDGDGNNNNSQYLYCAWAKNPLVASNDNVANSR
tara:strand:+ start:822 stop:1892 length:1071 start_codon:yes stop_codon:yes gene_type:complete